MRFPLTCGLAVVILALITSCSPYSEQLSAGATVKHVVIIVQENRSFDNIFHGLPGADTATQGLTHDGTSVALQPVSLSVGYDLDNSAADFERSYDSGRMDGYDLRRALPVRGDGVPLRLAQYPAYAYVEPNDVEPYFQLAKRYAVADRMFQSNIDQSFAAHLYLIAGTAGRSVDVPNGRPWGCDAKWDTVVQLLSATRRVNGAVYPCFGLTTIADELDAKQLTWRYYAPRVVPSRIWQRVPHDGEQHFNDPGRPEFGGNWSSFDAISQIRFGAEWSRRVTSPPSRIIQDVKNGRLADVTWVIPDWKNSDHSLSKSDTGPSWVAAVINTIGDSKFWASTAIFVTWDDSGGWYDHVPPPQLDYDGLGVRVPLIIVSPYAKPGFVSHTGYEFGSILKFVESVFGLPPLAASDHRANNIFDSFDFNQRPAVFHRISAKYSTGYFQTQRDSLVAPDRD